MARGLYAEQHLLLIHSNDEALEILKTLPVAFGRLMKKSAINHQISHKSSPSLCSRLVCHITLKYDSLLTHSALCLPLKIHEAALLLQPYTGLIEHLLRFDLQPKFKHLHPELLLFLPQITELLILFFSFCDHHLSKEIIYLSISFYSGATIYRFMPVNAILPRKLPR